MTDSEDTSKNARDLSPQEGHDAAIDALASDEAVSEVEAPTAEALEAPMPALADIPDDAGVAMAPPPEAEGAPGECDAPVPGAIFSMDAQEPDTGEPRADEPVDAPISDEEVRRIAMEALSEDEGTDASAPYPEQAAEEAATPADEPEDELEALARSSAACEAQPMQAEGPEAAPGEGAPLAAPEPDAQARQDAPDSATAPEAMLGGAAAQALGEASGAEDPAALGRGQSPAQTLPFAPVKPTARTSASASSRISGAAQATGALAWGSRSDVGRVREHNEDSYLVDFPLFAVADGMGGHAAGEVASTIAVSTLADCQLTKPDADALGAAVEQANLAVLDGVTQGQGRQGMGTTCTAVVIDGGRMAVGHVGDSRAYMLHEGKLLRVTHDHSFVEELVDAGEITPEEARVHPSRSIITRALGSDPHMRADAFTVDVTRGDRVLLCSDGLSSMVTDDVIEEAMVTSPAPQACADKLVDLALEAGGLDNVTAIVIDVKDDGIERHALRTRVRNVALWALAVLLVLAVICGGVVAFAHHTWYLSDNGGYVTLNKGIPGSIGAFSLHETVEQTNIEVSRLSEAVEERLARGISFGSEDDARLTLEKYRQQISGDGSQAGTSARGSEAASVSEVSSSASEGA